jgi:hypothetical protein
MLVLNRGQRELLADKVMDGANLALAGLFFAQFVTGASFSLPVAVLGITMWGLFSGFGVLLTRGESS